jgi:hypothetical protein
MHPTYWAVRGLLLQSSILPVPRRSLAGCAFVRTSGLPVEAPGGIKGLALPKIVTQPQASFLLPSTQVPSIMSGRGKGGKGLGKGGAKRHRKVLRDNIQVSGGADQGRGWQSWCERCLRGTWVWPAIPLAFSQPADCSGTTATPPAAVTSNS